MVLFTSCGIKRHHFKSTCGLKLIEMILNIFYRRFHLKYYAICSILDNLCFEDQNIELLCSLIILWSPVLLCLLLYSSKFPFIVKCTFIQTVQFIVKGLFDGYFTQICRNDQYHTCISSMTLIDLDLKTLAR